MYGGRETELHTFTTSVIYEINGELHCGCFKRNNVPISMDIYIYIYMAECVAERVWTLCFRVAISTEFGPVSSDVIATDYGLDGPRIEPQWGARFPPVQTGPGAHPASCTMGTGSFPGVKYGRGVLLTTHPLLVSRSWKSRAVPLPIFWATTGPVTGTLYLFISTEFENSGP